MALFRPDLFVSKRPNLAVSAYNSLIDFITPPTNYILQNH